VNYEPFLKCLKRVIDGSKKSEPDSLVEGFQILFSLVFFNYSAIVAKDDGFVVLHKAGEGLRLYQS
jgi:hypothetical protein